MSLRNGLARTNVYLVKTFIFYFGYAATWKMCHTTINPYKFMIIFLSDKTERIKSIDCGLCSPTIMDMFPLYSQIMLRKRRESSSYIVATTRESRDDIQLWYSMNTSNIDKSKRKLHYHKTS